MRLIDLSTRAFQNTFAIVDDEDFEALNKYRWSPTKDAHGQVYARAWIERKKVFMHRLIMLTPKGMATDHINGNRLDNRRSNLRVCSPRENQCNRGKPRTAKTSHYIGVSYSANRQKFIVALKVAGKSIFGGSFDSEVDAATARDRLAITHHGEFARLNFPEGLKCA